ncbi:hypothetical protein AYO21_11810 [Fonsecaea monophora]|uniref:Uncharacterized protein n=1 Tax=Fonsecaea monophora TaxID=254056 RepID=A0A177ESK5_9EURO|nr:hypothetical protein AYO21_11810 [Fonsecaea monophora]OAG34042.1 hypothetical protein AYO21_11810 [Fonsecaea monophora]
MNEVRRVDHDVIYVRDLRPRKGTNMIKANGMKAYIRLLLHVWMRNTPDVIVAEMTGNGNLVYLDTLARNGIHVPQSRSYVSTPTTMFEMPPMIVRGGRTDRSKMPKHVLTTIPNNGLVCATSFRTLRPKRPTIELLYTNGYLYMNSNRCMTNASVSRKIIVVFSAGRLQEMNEMKTSNLPYIAIDPEIQHQVHHQVHVELEDHDVRHQHEYIQVTGTLAVSPSSTPYHTRAINTLRSMSISTFGCGYIHDYMPRDGVGMPPTTMNMIRVATRSGHTKMIVRLVFDQGRISRAVDERGLEYRSNRVQSRTHVLVRYLNIVAGLVWSLSIPTVAYLFIFVTEYLTATKAVGGFERGQSQKYRIALHNKHTVTTDLLELTTATVA